MSSYHRSDKEEWDETMDERREARRHHYDLYDLHTVSLDLNSDPDYIDIDRERRSLRRSSTFEESWFWDDGREVDPELDDRYKASRLRGSRNGNDW